MDHADHVALLRGGIPASGGVWAEFGSGTGAFTLALAELIAPAGLLYSIDRDAAALREQARRLQTRVPQLRVVQRQADFTRPLALPPLDGLLLANALHFVRDKEPLVRRLGTQLRPGGRLILVEYDTDQGNPWVPHPLSYAIWEGLAARAGLLATRKLHAVPSRFLGEIYSALSLAPAAALASA